MSEKNSFVVYMDIKEVVDELEDKQVADLFRAMLEYQETGKVPKLTGPLKYIFIPIRQQMDRDAEKWDKTKAARAEAGRRGGLKSGEVRAKQNEANEANASFGSSNEANEAVNVNVNVNGNVNGNGNVSDRLPDASSLSLDLISYLNEKTGSAYKNDKRTTARVQSLLDSGYVPDQLRTVIDKKCAEWLTDEKMRGYLRPSTLFGEKFGEYLSAPISLAAEQARKAADARDALMRELNDKKAALAEITASIEEIPRDENGKLGPRLEEFRLLTDQKAILEDTITRLSGQLGN